MTVTRQNADVLEVSADALKLELVPGAYWIGLTPTINIPQHGQFFGLLTEGPLRTGVEPVLNKIGVDGSEEGWMTYHLAKYRSVPFNRNITLRIDGEGVAAGKVSTSPEIARDVDRSTRLRLRYGEFDPPKSPRQIPTKLAADDACRLWLVQFHIPPNDVVRKSLQERGGQGSVLRAR